MGDPPANCVMRVLTQIARAMPKRGIFSRSRSQNVFLLKQSRAQGAIIENEEKQRKGDEHGFGHETAEKEDAEKSIAGVSRRSHIAEVGEEREQAKKAARTSLRSVAQAMIWMCQ